MNTRENKNPFADKNGAPLDGKEEQFFAWAQANHANELDQLSPEERKEQAEADKRLAARMDS